MRYPKNGYVIQTDFSETYKRVLITGIYKYSRKYNYDKISVSSGVTQGSQISIGPINLFLLFVKI